MGGWVAGEMENKAIFQLEVVVEVEVELGKIYNGILLLEQLPIYIFFNGKLGYRGPTQPT